MSLHLGLHHQHSFHDDMSCGSTIHSPSVHEEHSDKAHWAKLRLATETLGIVHTWKRLAEEGKRLRLCVHTVMVICAQTVSILIMEQMLKRDPQASNLITFGNYVFVILTTLSQNGLSLVLERKIPFTNHFATAAVAVVREYMQNTALSMGLPMLVVLVVKNAGLLVSMLIGFIVLRLRFSYGQVGAVAVVTLGILRTVMSKPSSVTRIQASSDDLDLSDIIPVMLLLGSLVAGQALDIMDDYAFRTYGKYQAERMFYKFVLGMPMLLLNGRSLFNQAWSWTTDKTEDVFGIGHPVPFLWLLLLVNMLLVYLLNISAGEVVILSNAVILGLTFTVQRGVSTVLTAVLNAPPWPGGEMWFGIIHVFAGALAFTLAPKNTAPPVAKK